MRKPREPKPILAVPLALATFSMACGVVAAIAWWAWTLDVIVVIVVALLAHLGRNVRPHQP